MREDIQRLAPKGSWAFGTKHRLEQAAKALDAAVSVDEVIQEICSVNDRKSKLDLLALTDRRLVLVSPYASEAYPLSVVSSISDRDNVLSAQLSFVADGVERTVKVKEVEKAKNIVRIARELTARPAAAPTNAPALDPVAKVKELAALHSAGALTDDEFTAMKKKLLEQM